MSEDTVVPYLENYEYDDGGNLVSVRHVGAQNYTRTLIVDASSNRAQATSEYAPLGIEDAFDENGNRRVLARGQDLYWTARDQLARAVVVRRESPGNDEERYAYRSDGARLRKRRSWWVGTSERTSEALYLPGIER